MSRLRKRQQEEEKVPSSVVAPAALFSVLEAAKWFGISRAKLFELMHEEDFPVIRITKGVIRFDPNSLYQWSLKRQMSGRYIA